MKPMIWHPERKDEKVNNYLDRKNREPWLIITVIGIFIALAMTTLIVVGIF
jgi:hypothetical protein